MSEHTDDGFKDLIRCLEIFRKYASPRCPTHCEHDVMWIMGVDPEDVSAEDMTLLDALGFFVSDDGFKSFRFGSA